MTQEDTAKNQKWLIFFFILHNFFAMDENIGKGTSMSQPIGTIRAWWKWIMVNYVRRPTQEPKVLTILCMVSVVFYDFYSMNFDGVLLCPKNGPRDWGYVVEQEAVVFVVKELQETGKGRQTWYQKTH